MNHTVLNGENDSSKKIKICFQDVDWPPYTFGPNSRFNGKGALPELLTYIKKNIEAGKMKELYKKWTELTHEK